MLFIVLYIITYNYSICQHIIYVRWNVMEDKLIINKKNLKGEDGYKTFSVRIKEETVIKLNKLSEETNRSRNELINILLDYAIDNSEVK